MTSPGAGAALVARRYFDRYGTEQPRTRRGAGRLSQARLDESRPRSCANRSTIEDHQASRFVCEPLHLLDYCLINDGAACVIVTTAERARDAKGRRSISAGCRDCRAGARNSSGPIPGFGVAQQPVFEYEAGAAAGLQNGGS